MCASGFPFRDLINPVLSPLIARYHPHARSRVFPPETVVFTYISGALSGDKSLKSAVIRNNADRALQGLTPSSLGTSSLSDARHMLDTGVLRDAARGYATTTQSQFESSVFWEGMAPYALDGTTITANDTSENQAQFPQHGAQSEGAGFPLIRVLILQSLRSGMVTDCAFDAFQGKETGEMALARKVMGNISQNDLLLGDRYFPSFFMMADLVARGAQGVFQSHAARDVDFRRGESLGKRDHLVEWTKPQRPVWMEKEVYESYPQILSLREVDVTHEARQSTTFVLVTTLVDAKKFSKQKLAKFYRKRWNIELALRDLKSTFHMDHIAANTPEMIEKGIWGQLLAYNMLRWHMLNAATLCEVPIENVSVKSAAEIMMQNSAFIMKCTEETKAHTFATVYFQMTQVPVGKRPGREEPRAVKRRPKPRERLNEPRSVWHERRNT